MVITAQYNQKEEILFLTKETHGQGKMGSFIKEDKKVLIFDQNKKLSGVNYFDFKDSKLKNGIVENDKINTLITEEFDSEYQSPFVIGKIIEITAHPKSEKLNVCMVDLGEKKEQIVCGAANVQLGSLVIVAVVGAVLPSGLEIVPTKLIDVPSNGMICSYKELGLLQSEPGIAILSNSEEIGTSFFKKVR